MPRVSVDHLQARRRQILDGARAAFAQHGYEGATVRILEQEIGLSRGAIFHHYADKDALFLALATQDADIIVQTVTEHGLVQVMREMVGAPDPGRLGVRAVIVESFERIHRSNLIGMGVIPLQFPPGETVRTLALDGDETFDISGITELNAGGTPRTVKVTATKPGGGVVEFDAVVRIDTPGEADYYRNGGIMQYVLRSLLAAGG